ncbi:MAG: DUF5597 domain-containing protein [Rhizorhabdus sp.]
MEADWAQEGRFERGTWIAGRLLNGDERDKLLPDDKLNVVRIRLLTRP